ncbi:MAG: hypothetical protein ACI9O4_001704 [Chitinophagales bacterium]|jgi:hypothetical protein
MCYAYPPLPKKTYIMKNLIILLISALCFLQANAQKGIYLYSIKYENSSDLLIKIPNAPDDLVINIEGQSDMLELVDDVLLLENIPTQESFYVNLKFKFQDTILSKLLIDSEKPEMLQLDLPLYKGLSQWATKGNQAQKLSERLVQLSQDRNIHDAEILYFMQQYLGGYFLFQKELELKDNLQYALSAYKSTSDKATGCRCVQLNHEAHLTPVQAGGGQFGNGYNYFGTNGQFSQALNDITYFSSNSPKWHRWYSNEKGPAHDLFLRQYDQGGSFNYEWSTFGQNNAPSPNNATLLFNFFCSELGEELPDECDCTKKVTVLYRYDVSLNVIARKLKPVSKVHSIAQEISAVTYASNSGFVKVLDAGMAKYETKCNGSFNFDFIRNWFELGKVVLGLVIDVQDSTSGSIPQDILGNLGAIADELEDIATTSPITVTGDCTPKNGKATLMAGGDVLEMKANDPVVVTLSSFTFLGTYGKRKWDNYANTKSDFWLQGFVSAGSLEGSDHCCSDKVTRFTQASVDGPQSETDLVNWIEAWIKLYAPWDNFVQVGDLPILNRKTNRGYFVHDDPDRDCFPASPKILNPTTHESMKPTNDQGAVQELGINEVKNNSIKAPLSHVEKQVKIYPNPSNDLINLEISNAANSTLRISIYNSLGQEVVMVHDGIVLENNFKLTWHDDQNILDSGTYFVIVKTNHQILNSTPLRILK